MSKEPRFEENRRTLSHLLHREKIIRRHSMIHLSDDQILVFLDHRLQRMIIRDCLIDRFIISVSVSE